jgi:hypothetical protein
MAPTRGAKCQVLLSKSRTCWAEMCWKENFTNRRSFKAVQCAGGEDSLFLLLIDSAGTPHHYH